MIAHEEERTQLTYNLTQLESDNTTLTEKIDELQTSHLDHNEKQEAEN